MKLKHIALAAVLAATGLAHAGVDSGAASGDGTLLASVSYGNASAGSSASFDLGLSYSQLASWQADINATLSGGASEWFRSWNLSTGEASGTGLVTSVIGNYGTALADFNAAAAGAGATSTAQLQVLALDGVGTAVGSRGLYATGNAINATGGAATIASTSNLVNNGFNSTTVNGFFGAVNTSGTHATDANGANFASAGSTAYFNNGGGMEKVAQTSMFDTNGQYNGTYAEGTTTFAGQQQALAFFNQVSSSLTTTAKAKLTAIGYDFDADGTIEFDNNGASLAGFTEYGVWTLQGDVLKFSVAAVPEPETYAMLLAGLALMGGIARRRNKKA